MYHRSINAVHVEATDRCNAQCPVCIRSHQGGPEREQYVTNSELGLQHFKKYLGDVFCANVVNWNFCGNKGDPSSALELVDIFEYILKCNPETTITMRTNGGARNESFWESIGKLFHETNCQMVFAVDGLEDTNHIYRKNVKWKNLLRNMKAYFNNGGFGLGWFDTLKFQHNEHQWEEIEHLAKSFGVWVNLKEPYGFAKLPDGKLKTIPVYDRTLTKADGISSTNDIYKLLYTIKPHTTKNYVEGDYYPMSPQDIIDNDQPFYDYNNERLFEYSDAKIDCVADQPRNDHAEIFLDCDGSVYPCCFIGSRINVGEPQLDSMLGDTDIVLSDSNNIFDILKTHYYQVTLPDGINGNFTGDLTLGGKTNHCITCVDCCGMKMELSHIQEK
jgi:MoaA/NifB/PqqE/SkfB family radical SAM enzyme